MNSGASRVVYCAPEDSYFKKLSRLADDFVLEAGKVSFQGSPQKLARTRKASVLLLKVRPDFDVRVQEWLSKSDKSVPVIVLCQNGTIESAIHALQYGIYDYFSTSQNIEVVVTKIREAVIWKKTKGVKRPSASDYSLLMGKNPAIVRVNEEAQRLASASGPVLLLGEAGTGKEHLAKGIHHLSRKKENSFVRYDCRLLKYLTQYDGFSIPDLIRLRLQTTMQQADSPVLYLAHMEQLPFPQQQEIMERFNKSQIRVMASYQVSLFQEETVSRHTSLSIPPLRQHREDIPLLADHFIKRICQNRGIRTKELTEEVLMLLQEYAWPGNIQELSNLMERMISLESSNLITARTWRMCHGYGTKMNMDTTNQFARLLEDFVKGSEHEWAEGQVYDAFIERMEKLLIDLVMPKVNDNQAVAARILGISRNTLRQRRKSDIA